MQSALETLAGKALEKFGIRTTFTGFINQSELFRHYLASDIVVLPSRRMGEAWGLVVNESLNAGCSVIISDAVGCVAEFGDLDRVRIIGVGDQDGLAKAMANLAGHERCFRWAEQKMLDYSSQAAAKAIGIQFMAHLK